MTADLVLRGRELFGASAWVDCFSVLSQAEEQGVLLADDVELLAQSAFLIGRDQQCVDVWARAYQRFEESGEHRLAARAAFWIAFILVDRGEQTRGGGWLARARALVDAHDLGGSEEGLLLTLEAHVALVRGQTAVAVATACRAIDVGAAASDADVLALARLTTAWAHLRAAERAEAMADFDEVMVSVSAEETSPSVAGLVYCAVIDACMQLRDLRRAAEWTESLSSWCEARPDLVPYRGTCLVHRSQILTLRGDWAAAVEEATQACTILPEREAGAAFYQLGELNRLRGRYQQAEADYRRANTFGRRPEPGLARLRMAQGSVDAAVRALSRASQEARTAEGRAELLGALSEAHLAAGDVGAARAAADQLAGIAWQLDAPALSGLAAQSVGRVLLAEGAVVDALSVLRKGWQLWRELDLPFHAGQVRVLIARCLHALGDEDSARMERDAARDVFSLLGAKPELAELDALLSDGAGTAGGLTDREVQVIRLLASGRSNRAIAEELFLSEKTIARHLSNIYAKLDVTSRAAATAYAYDHGLV